MSDETKSWDVRPENPERDGWHWLLPAAKIVPAYPSGMQWVASWGAWKVGNNPVSVAHIAGNGWQYVGRALTPDEMRAALATARAEGWKAGQEDMRERAAYEAKASWLTCVYADIADADAMCALSDHADRNIRALPLTPAQQEPGA